MVDSGNAQSTLPLSGRIRYSASMPSDLSIVRCPQNVRKDALRVLHEGLPTDQQEALLHTFAGLHQESESVFDGLMIARQEDRIVASTWAQVTAGNSAVVWQPEREHPASRPLVQAAVDFLDEQRIDLAQIVVHPDSEIDLEVFNNCEFHLLANLAYMTLENTHFPSSMPPSELTFEPRACFQPIRLEKLLTETYEQSLDCPALNGVRNPADVIDDYAVQGTPNADTWFFVQHGGKDVGCLILTSHAEGEHWELIYMGIVPSARGQRFGWQTLQFALWKAQIQSAKRMVLAVDHSNEHALRPYRKAGFVVWDHRSVYGRFRNK